MKPAEDGQGDDRARRLRRARHRLPMVERLMRPTLVVEPHVLANEPCEMFIAEDEDVIEELAA